MEKLLIDVDDTLLVGAMQALCEDYLGHKFDMSTLPPGTYINQVLDSASFRSFFMEHNLYDYSETEAYVVESVRELSNHFDVYIASTYTYPNTSEFSPIMLPRKLDYLNKYFSFLGEKKFLFVGDKSVLDFDISIGDSFSDMIGKRKNFLLTRQHNKHIQEDGNIIRVSSWQEIMEQLIKK